MQASKSLSSTSQEQPSATGEIPTFNPGMSAPSIQVGGGGKGQPPPHDPGDRVKSLSDTVGEMAEKGSASDHTDQGTVLRERGTDEPPNPKKRMWEEPTATQEGSRPRDEL